MSKSKLPGRRRQPARGKGDAAIYKAVRAMTRAPAFQRYITNLLVELCRVDTTPSPDVGRMRTAEAECFAILERELCALPFSRSRLERRPINPGIQTHPHYSLLHFTKTPERPLGLSAEETYAGRSNLLYFLPGDNGGKSGASIALNAHVDVVAPYFPPRVRGGVVFGRGACDDKGPVVSIVAALQVLARIMAERGLRFNLNVVVMFVVEEETGGNGSLSLATDRELKAFYDSVLVAECAGLKIYPANRGAVWYRAELKPPPGVSAFEMAAFVIEELEKEGAAIRAESRHALFPQRPVQTCHGMIGPFGEHPSRICGEVRFEVRFKSRPNVQTAALVRDCLEAGLAGYVGLYGDKTRVTDAATGKPIVASHYRLQPLKTGFLVSVYGATGHMGAIRERDGAITKMAHLVRSLFLSRAKLETCAGEMRLELDGATDGPLVLEGGQGFVPTHDITEVMERLRRAARRGADHYLTYVDSSVSAESIIKVTYEKLHNVAFDADPRSTTMRHALNAARTCGLWNNEPVLGWTVSCDARLFASEYPGMPVLTFGPGQLAYAHSDHEQIAVKDIQSATEFLVLFLLKQTGTI